jgi:hypothetical protein
MAFSIGSNNTLEMLERIDKKLNDLSQSQFINQLIVAGVAAGGAIAGAYLTSHSQISIHKKKETKEEEIENKYKKNVISTIKAELKTFDEFLSLLLNNSVPFKSVLSDERIKELSEGSSATLNDSWIVKDDKKAEIDFSYSSKFGNAGGYLYSPPTKYKTLPHDTKLMIFGDNFLKIDEVYQRIDVGIEYRQWINYSGIFSKSRVDNLLVTIKIASESLEEYK